MMFGFKGLLVLTFLHTSVVLFLNGCGDQSESPMITPQHSPTESPMISPAETATPSATTTITPSPTPTASP